MTENFLLQIAIMLAGAKIAGELCERFLKQPAVLAEIVVGVLLGVSMLKWVDGNNVTLQSIAEIGAVLLLFEVGLECDLEELLRVGKEAIFVAIAGVVLPFAGGYLAAHAMGHDTIHSLFIGAALTATSVGITARVFTDMKVLHTNESKIVLGAAVADDVIGLIILAAISGLAGGATSAAAQSFSWLQVVETSALALGFLVGGVLVGFKFTPVLLKAARAMNTRAAVSSAAVAFCLLMAALAHVAGLAPIVGAFAAGLVLNKTEDKIRFEEKVRSIGDLFVPVFFVMMGARMDLASINSKVVVIGSILFVIAIIGKVVGGLLLPAKGVDRVMVGFGMIPRGEVGLIFASIGLSRGIIDQGLYAAIVFVVIGTTFVTPPLLKFAAARALRREIVAPEVA